MDLPITQAELDRAVTAATGDSGKTIRQRGFVILTPSPTGEATAHLVIAPLAFRIMGVERHPNNFW
jgi:hypothetical protein